MKLTNRLPPEGINASAQSPLVELGYLLAGVVAAVVLVYFALGLVADALVARISPQTEARLARLLLPATEALAPKRRARRAPQQLLDRLVEKAPPLPYPIRVQIACDPAINALALPGGHIVLLQGLLDRVRSENELALILAHELGHFHLRHHLRGLGRGLVWVSVMALLHLGTHYASALINGTGRLVAMRYSQEQEVAADRFGAELLAKVYGHVGGLADFFLRMARERPEAALLGWFSTHPAATQRLARLRALVQQRGWREGPRQPWAKVESGCPPLVEKPRSSPPQGQKDAAPRPEGSGGAQAGPGQRPGTRQGAR
ncbi:MAG: M48 family metallopeptidase [Proteobacteria bacterium]|nr:M48 family metallopeptidase [Pseudomonadota bacterium]